MANWKLDEAPPWYADQWREEERANRELLDAIEADNEKSAQNGRGVD